MKKLAILALFAAALVGCSGGSSDASGSDTASPTANLPAPPPGPAKNIPKPPTMGGAPGAAGSPSPAAKPGG